jgi:hypothetical protein
VHEFVAATYAENDVSLKLGTPGGKNLTFLEEVLKSCAKQRTEKHSYTEYNQPNIHRYLSLKDSNSDYGYVFYQNLSDSCTLEERVEFTEMEGFSLQFPYEGNCVAVTVAPNEEKIAILKRVADKTKFKCCFYTSVKEKNLDLGQEAVKKGEKNTIETIDYYSYNYDNGVVYQFINKGKEIV